MENVYFCITNLPDDMDDQQNIIIYRTADGRASVALYAKDGKIWLRSALPLCYAKNQQQMAALALPLCHPKNFLPPRSQISACTLPTY